MREGEVLDLSEQKSGTQVFLSRKRFDKWGRVSGIESTVGKVVVMGRKKKLAIYEPPKDGKNSELPGLRIVYSPEKLQCVRHRDGEAAVFEYSAAEWVQWGTDEYLKLLRQWDPAVYRKYEKKGAFKTRELSEVLLARERSTMPAG